MYKKLRVIERVRDLERGRSREKETEIKEIRIVIEKEKEIVIEIEIGISKTGIDSKNEADQGAEIGITEIEDPLHHLRSETKREIKTILASIIIMQIGIISLTLTVIIARITEDRVRIRVTRYQRSSLKKMIL